MVKRPIFAAALAIVFVIALSEVASAANLFDNIQGVYSNAAAGFEGAAATLSQQIFYSGLLILDVMWVGFEIAFTAGANPIWVMGKAVVGYGLGAYLIAHQTPIVDNVRTAIAQIQGNFVLGGGVLTPGAIAQLGWNAAGQLGNSVAPSGDIIKALLIALSEFVASFLIQLSYIVVAAEDLVINIGVQLAIVGGSVLLGLVATRWTRPVAQTFVTICVTGLLLNIAIGIVAGLGIPITDAIQAMAAAMGNPNANVPLDLATIAATAFVYLIVAIGVVGLAGLMGARTHTSVGGAVVNAVSNAVAYVAGTGAGAAAMGGGGGGAGAGAGAAGANPIAQIEAATNVAA